MAGVVRTRGLWLPLGIFLLNAGLYFATLSAAVAVPWVALKALLLAANGFLVGSLFLIGHDACHGSFTGRDWLNRLVGRLAFLPSLMPPTSWRYNHNYVHHSFTNCADRDYVWRPFSLAEYRALPRARRWLERAYRTVPGLPLNWIVANWWTKKLFPSPALRRRMRRWGSLRRDRAAIGAWLLAQAAGALAAEWLVRGPVSAGPFLLELLLYLAAPFLVWSALISYVVLLQHTHPAVPWFADHRGVAFRQRQVGSTVHYVLPLGTGFLFHNIMEHTAHHVDPAIPMYHLTQAQAQLEAELPGRVTVVFYSPLYLFRLLRRCRLYDYGRGQWLDFDGRPTAPAVFGPPAPTEVAESGRPPVAADPAFASGRACPPGA
jgi:omega-6 fatty acid desaturase (delta-12 desaturase)